MRSLFRKLAITSMPLILPLVVSCQSHPQVISAQPLPVSISSATTPAPTASAAPVNNTTMVIATSPPPAVSPIKQLLETPRATHVAPPRTCPKLPQRPLNVSTPGNGPAVIVNVFDYLSLAPIADVQVNLFHGDVCMRDTGCKPSHPHPENQLKMTGKTDAQGQIVFSVPDLDYSSFIPENPIPGHLPFSPDYNLGSQKCHDLFHERRTGNGKALVLEKYVVPESMLAIRTQEEAIDNAFQLEELITWLRQHQDVTMTVRRRGGDFWEIGFGQNDRFQRLVLVNGLNGSASMLGRWD